MGVYRFAWAAAVVFFALALCVLGAGLIWLVSLPKGGGGGEGGYVIIATIMMFAYGFQFLAFASLCASVVAAIKIRAARRFLILTLPLALFGVWLAGASHPVRTVDTVGPKDVPRLIQSLARQQGEDWDRSVFLLAHLGEEAAPDLAEALKDHDPQVRRGAARALRDMAWRARIVIPQLAEALATDDVEVREYCAAALGYGSTGPAEIAVSLPALTVALDDPNEMVRFHAAGAINWIALNLGPRAADAIPVLIKALGNRDASVRSYAAEALGRIGPAAAAAVPALRRALGDENESVRREASDALAKIEKQNK